MSVYYSDNISMYYNEKHVMYYPGSIVAMWMFNTRTFSHVKYRYLVCDLHYQ